MAINITSIQTDYLNQTNGAGTPGYEGGVEISYEGDILTFTEADGDTYNVNAANLSDADIQSLAASLNATIKGTEEASETTSVNSTDDLDANKAKMEKLQGQWDNLNGAAETIKETVEKLSEEIKEALDAALKEQEKITEDEQKRISELVSTQIEQFKKDKENGKDVKMSDLEGSIKDGLASSGFDEEMSSIMSSLVVTNAKMVQMDTLLDELGVLNGQMKMLDTEMTELADTIEKQEEEAAKCCDPIGFENEEGTKFEFVIDKDGNGELSNFSEFLGSENFFDEMVALDADGSGDVSTDEMNAAGVKVLVTEKDGTQSMKSIAEAFGGEDVNVNLGSYKEAQEGAKASNGQQLLGNFDISVGEASYEGYSTLDTEEYLTSNYNFTDANPVNAGVTAEGAAVDGTEEADGATDRAQTTQSIDQFIEDYSAKLEEFEAQFETITELLGLDQELIETVQEFAQTVGTAAAKSIIDEAEAEIEAQEEKEAEKDAEVGEAEGANNDEAEDDKDKEEEKEAA